VKPFWQVQYCRILHARAKIVVVNPSHTLEGMGQGLMPLVGNR